VVSLLSGIAVAAGRLGAPLSMQALGLSAADIVSTATVGGLVTIPIALMIGALSDRQGRGRFLMLCYLLAAAAAVILSNATQVWHFWLAAILTQLALCTNGALASALATDWIAPETLGRDLPWINTMQSIASVLSFASVGYIMDTLGATPLYLTVTALALVAALQFIWLQRHTQRGKSVATGQPGVSGVPGSSPMPSLRTTGFVGEHAVAIGSGMAGLTAARVLADHFSRVTIVERDHLSDAPEHRQGVPQARHAHTLMPRGQLILEQYFPGLVGELRAFWCVVTRPMLSTRSTCKG